MIAYLDTSALAKLYLREPARERFLGWVYGQDERHISTLGVTEMESILSRLRRTGGLTGEEVNRIRRALGADIDSGFLVQLTVGDEDIRRAGYLMSSQPELGFRTLDAIHLAVAVTLDPDQIATADRRLADVAEALGMTVERFD